MPQRKAPQMQLTKLEEGHKKLAAVNCLISIFVEVSAVDMRSNWSAVIRN
jgi:hypothetical protein